MKVNRQAESICAAVLFFLERHSKLTEEKKTENINCSEAAEQHHTNKHEELEL